jgi:hypothetical protein
MSGWTDDELATIEGTQEMNIAARRKDGTLRRSVPIWVVRAGDDLYVRAAYGAGSGWHRVAQASGQARIQAGDVEKDVTLEEVHDAVNDQVDAGYRAKYGRYSSIVDGITDAEARGSTLRVVPSG